VGDAPLHLRAVFPRLALSEYDADCTVFVWNHLRYSALAVQICGGVPAALRVSGGAVSSKDVQVLHPHNRSTGEETGSSVRFVPGRGCDVLAGRPALVQPDVEASGKPSRACFVACVDGFQFVFREHILTVLPSSAARLEPEDRVLAGSSALREGSEERSWTKGAIAR